MNRLRIAILNTKDTKVTKGSTSVHGPPNRAQEIEAWGTPRGDQKLSGEEREESEAGKSKAPNDAKDTLALVM